MKLQLLLSLTLSLSAGSLVFKSSTADAGVFMSSQMLADFAQSENESERAMAHGYIAAVHDVIQAENDLGDDMCVNVPQNMDLLDMALISARHLQVFVEYLNADPDYIGKPFPAIPVIHYGLSQSFPCNPT